MKVNKTSEQHLGYDIKQKINLSSRDQQLREDIRLVYKIPWGA